MVVLRAGTRWHDAIMRVAVAAIWVCALTATARADDTDVDLLALPGSVVAVSSTVDNAKFVPEHLVDGDPGTAWNSRTGDLVGAWIAFRVPDDTTINTIRMTVGFTKKDPRLGDLFTMNQRIKKVEVISGDGKFTSSHTFDPDVRTLQDIPLARRGGTYFIKIVELVPCTKPDWREVAVSELAVSGTIAGPASAKSHRPPVRVASLDVDCAKVLFPNARANRIASNDVIRAIDPTTLAPDLATCAVEHGAPGADTAVVELAAVQLPARSVVVGKRVTIPIRRHASVNHTGSDAERTAEVRTSAFALTGSENALLVDVEVIETTGASGATDVESTLYRVSRRRFAPVLTWKTSSGGGESYDGATCKLEVGADRAPLPDLDRKCVRKHERYPGNPDDVSREWTEVTHFRWDGSKYGELSAPRQ